MSLKSPSFPESLKIIPPPRRRPKLRGARRVCAFASPPASRFLRPHPEFFLRTVSRTRAPAGAGVSLASEPPEPPAAARRTPGWRRPGGRRGREKAREGSPGPRAPPTAPRTQLRVPARAPRTQGAACGKAPDATQGSRGCSRESTSRPRAQRPPPPPSDRPGPRGRGPRAFLVARQPGGSSFPRPWRGAEGHRFPRWRPATGGAAVSPRGPRPAAPGFLPAAPRPPPSQPPVPLQRLQPPHPPSRPPPAPVAHTPETPTRPVPHPPRAPGSPRLPPPSRPALPRHRTHPALVPTSTSHRQTRVPTSEGGGKTGAVGAVFGKAGLGLES